MVRTALTAATVMTASPAPISSVRAEHRRQDGAERHGARDRELERGRGRAGHHREPGADGGDRQDRLRRAAVRATCISPPTSSAPIDAHVEDVRAERGEPAVGEHERLHAEHDRQREAGEPGAEQDRGERGAEEVSARASRHREVEHLRGEDERRGDAEQRDAALVEVGSPGAGRCRRRRRRARRTPARPRSRGNRQGCAWGPQGS